MIYEVRFQFEEKFLVFSFEIFSVFLGIILKIPDISGKVRVHVHT